MSDSGYPDYPVFGVLKMEEGKFTIKDLSETCVCDWSDYNLLTEYDRFIGYEVKQFDSFVDARAFIFENFSKEDIEIELAKEMNLSSSYKFND